MGTIDEVTTRSPRILMIGGREHVLVQGLGERIQIADPRLLWRESARVWMFLLFPVLNIANGELFDTNGWVLLGTFAVLGVALAMSFFGKGRSVMITPVTVVETERSGTWSQLAMSTPRNVSTIATVHTDMADFLLRTVSADRTRRARLRREIPSELKGRGSGWYEWNVLAAVIATIAAIVVIYLVRWAQTKSAASVTPRTLRVRRQ